MGWGITYKCNCGGSVDIYYGVGKLDLYKISILKTSLNPIDTLRDEISDSDLLIVEKLLNHGGTLEDLEYAPVFNPDNSSVINSKLFFNIKDENGKIIYTQEYFSRKGTRLLRTVKDSLTGEYTNHFIEAGVLKCQKCGRKIICNDKFGAHTFMWD